MSLGQQSKNPGLHRLCPHGPQGSLPLAHLPHAFFSFSLLRQCPASRYGSTRRDLRKPLLGPEGHGGLGPRLSRLPLPAELVKPGNIDQSPGEAIRVRELLGEREHLVASLLRLVRIAQKP